MDIMSLILRIPGLVLALSLHEFAHGYAAYKMGDNTAKYSGRLSLNPLDHMDVVGTLCLFLFRFGWAKPVPINPYNFRNRRAGIITVSLAGPAMNFLLALVCALLYAVVAKFVPYTTFTTFVIRILVEAVAVNIGLMCFNLIPIPPLDCSKVLIELLPYRYRGYFYTIERYSTLILMLALWSGVLNPVLGTMYSAAYAPIKFIIGLIW